MAVNKKIVGTISFIAIAVTSGLLISQLLKQFEAFEALDAFDVEEEDFF